MKKIKVILIVLMGLIILPLVTINAQNKKVGYKKVEENNEPIEFNKIKSKAVIVNIELFKPDDTTNRVDTFYHINFKQAVDYSNKIISGDDIEDITFDENAQFKNCTFLWPDVSIKAKKKIEILNSSFGNWFSLENSQCKGSVHFGKDTFFSDINFRESIFNSAFEAQESYFCEPVFFSGIVFNGWADFADSKFYKRLMFSACEFDNVFRFIDKTEVKGKLTINLCKFNQNAELRWYTELPDTIDFTNNTDINKELDFTSVPPKKDKPYQINFLGSNLSKIKINYQYFQLYFPENTSYDLKASVYEGLLNKLKSIGYEDGYKKLDIEFKKLTYKYNNHPLTSIILEYWWNYGYNKEYIFLWTIGFIILFTFFNFFLLTYLNTKIYPLENIEIIPFSFSFKKISFRLWYSFVYTSTVFFRLNLKIEKINFKHVIGTIYLLVIYTLGLLCLAYMVNFVVQK